MVVISFSYSISISCICKASITWNALPSYSYSWTIQIFARSACGFVVLLRTYSIFDTLAVLFLYIYIRTNMSLSNSKLIFFTKIIFGREDVVVSLSEPLKGPLLDSFLCGTELEALKRNDKNQIGCGPQLQIGWSQVATKPNLV